MTKQDKIYESQIDRLKEEGIDIWESGKKQRNTRTHTDTDTLAHLLTQAHKRYRNNKEEKKKHDKKVLSKLLSNLVQKNSEVFAERKYISGFIF